MKAKCIDDKGEMKLCPYRVYQEEKKALMIGNGDMVIQMFYPCLGERCVGYHEGVCLIAHEALTTAKKDKPQSSASHPKNNGDDDISKQIDEFWDEIL